ncbi:hypothetical protein [Paenibacillus qinlingensis]|nr:hypothetical protein [Paenibacillus qinlingensis]
MPLTVDCLRTKIVLKESSQLTVDCLRTEIVLKGVVAADDCV